MRKVVSLYRTDSTRNDPVKLSAFLIKCKAMMGICIYCGDKSADTLYLEKGANRFVQAVGNISQSEINSWSHNIVVVGVL